jgi:hypothetical protein
VDFAEIKKNLEIPGQKALRQFPKRSTNSFTARAEVLPGGNSRDAGETRATGKPGNRDFSCCFKARRVAAERQEAGKPAARCDAARVGPLRLILGGAPFACPPLESTGVRASHTGPTRPPFTYLVQPNRTKRPP